MTRHRLLVVAAALAVAAGVSFATPLDAAATTRAAHVVLVAHHSRTPGPVQIATGHANGCEVERSGILRCWGWNFYGQLGDGGTRPSPVPVVVHGLAGVRQVSIGFGHACALLQNRTVQCWGWNKYGQLGNNRDVNSSLHVAVLHLAGVRTISLGFEHSCALLLSGIVKCWGWNYYGQLGNGSTSNAGTPVVVRGLRGVVQIVAGYGHNCALLRSGSVKCWGYNLYGELGDGSTRNSTVPVAVKGLPGFVVSLAAGFGHTCAVMRTGGAWCWGLNQFGQLGSGSKRNERVPVVVRGLTGVAQLALGFGHSCALLRARTVECWGWNKFGALGIGNFQSSVVPRDVRIAGVVQLVAGDDSVCALLDLGMYTCWGSNVNDQLGDGTTASLNFPRFTPFAPTRVRATPLPGAAIVRWHAPTSDGLGAITRYTVLAHPGTSRCVTRALFCKVPELTNGVRYEFTVAAANLAGLGLASSPSAAVVPATLPGPPTNVAAVRGDRSAEVSWGQPASDGGSHVKQYLVTAADSTTPANGGETCSTSGALVCIVPLLTNGDSYTFTVIATNSVGTSPTSASSPAVIPAAVPGVPTSVSATAENAAALVSWAPAPGNGGTITAYKVTATDTTTPANGGETCTTTGALQCTVSLLTNGDDYTFGVSATNNVGPGPNSLPTSPVVPATVPGAPTAVSAVAGNASALVSWIAPASNGGSAITGYTVTAKDTTTPANGGETCTASGALQCTVSLLTNGDDYTFSVTATNVMGTGPASSASSPVVPATVPGKPTSVSATAGNASAHVTWVAPGNGGSPITGYTVTATDTTTPANGGETCTTTGALQCTVSGLTNGDSYTFAVTATNSAGTGPASLPSAAVVPAAVPGKPTSVSASAGNASALVSWVAPGSGGSPITGYTVTATDTTTSANGGETCTTAGALQCTDSGLTNGDNYTFTVTAKNAVGTGLASLPSNAVVPATAPGKPTSVSATAGNASALVSWSAPGSNGGSAITGYTATATDATAPANGGETCTTAGALQCTVSGLTNGDSYTFTVTAANGAGTSPPSNPSAAVVPAAVPGRPTSVSATAGNASAQVSWSAPGSNGGSPITGYTATATDTTTSGNGGETCTTAGALQCTVSGLTNGDSYTFTVTATNGAGTSPPSNPSAAVVPATVPGAPTSVSASPGDTTADVTWVAPGDGGSPITGYTATATDTTTSANGGETCTTAGAVQCTVTGLTDGDSYTFTVTATNDVGTSAASDPSAAVVPAGVPGAPTSVVAVPGIASAIVSWSAPASDGGSPITGYTATATDTTTSGNGGETCTTTGALLCTVMGLTTGDSYTFSVTATNAVGTGPPSAPSSPIIAAVLSLFGTAFGITQPSGTAQVGADLWVVDTAGNAVTELVATSGAKVQTLSGGILGFDGPTGIAYDGVHLWVTSSLGRSLTELATSGTFLRALSDGSYRFNGPAGITFEG